MTDWQPGDPLYQPPGPLRLPIFAFKDDPLSTWTDGASWPIPRRRDDLDRQP